eukprot:9296033-Pyramimonas_sp.AAC.2
MADQRPPRTTRLRLASVSTFFAILAGLFTALVPIGLLWSSFVSMGGRSMGSLQSISADAAAGYTR